MKHEARHDGAKTLGNDVSGSIAQWEPATCNQAERYSWIIMPARNMADRSRQRHYRYSDGKRNAQDTCGHLKLQNVRRKNRTLRLESKS